MVMFKHSSSTPRRIQPVNVVSTVVEMLGKCDELCLSQNLNKTLNLNETQLFGTWNRNKKKLREDCLSLLNMIFPSPSLFRLLNY